MFKSCIPRHLSTDPFICSNPFLCTHPSLKTSSTMPHGKVPSRRSGFEQTSFIACPFLQVSLAFSYSFLGTMSWTTIFMSSWSNQSGCLALFSMQSAVPPSGRRRVSVINLFTFQTVLGAEPFSARYFFLLARTLSWTQKGDALQPPPMPTSHSNHISPLNFCEFSHFLVPCFSRKAAGKCLSHYVSIMCFSSSKGRDPISNWSML